MGKQASFANDWQNEQKKINNKVEQLYETSMLFDCEFIVGPKPSQQEFKGHKLILAMSSPVFEAMFYGSLAEQGKVVIPDLKPNIFRTILKYIYVNTLKVESLNEAFQVYNGAKKYLLPHLTEECVNYMISILTPSIVCEVYEFAKYTDEPELKKNCVKVLTERTGEVLTVDSFNEASLDLIVDIFAMDDINIVSELELFTALERWMGRNKNVKEPTSNGLTFRDALKHIRFLTMTSTEFADGPADSDLLTEEEKLSILKALCSQKFDSMPEGLSQSKIPRKKVRESVYLDKMRHQIIQLPSQPLHPGFQVAMFGVRQGDTFIQSCNQYRY